jgi:hypothetical protein
MENHLTPPRTIPNDLFEKFTVQRKIPVRYGYIDESVFRDQPVVYEKDVIDQYIQLARARENNYYGRTDQHLYQALNLISISGKQVAVIGSTKPWYESIAIAYGAFPTTIDYNKVVSHDPRIKSFSVDEYQQNPIQFDALFSISSFEHDGLGRYGDPISPDGDLVAMKKAMNMLTPGGYLFLAIPVGKDLLVWNQHRVYGAIRLPMLLQGWELVCSIGFSAYDLYLNLDGTEHQPLFVCKKPTASNESGFDSYLNK